MNLVNDGTHTNPGQVHETLKRYMLADGYSVVFDYDRSRGTTLVDARQGDAYLDLFSFFASQPIGYNHPKMLEPEWLAHLGKIATMKPTNADLYTTAMADFVRTFAETVIPESHRHHLFFVEGGALGVENALKAAFDWKFRKNASKGLPDSEDLEVIHFRHAFHGRSGYTLSLTNTHDPRKFQYFPKFKWPRIVNPSLSYPLTEQSLEATMKLEAEAVRQIEDAIVQKKNRIAAIIIETIQAEGGDNHFRPEFLKKLREIADRDEIMLIFDEVQAGMGLTGTWWAWQQMGVQPDIFAFGKKAQVCGIAATSRLDDVESVFKIPSRINSTWGANLTDMVRSQRFIEIVRDEKMLENVKSTGAYLMAGLEKLARETGKVFNVRGRGLMIAFDLATEDERNAMRKRLFDAKAIALGCGEKSIRLRPVLDFDRAAADRAIDVIRRCL